jgi:hypothetical protein
MMVTCDKLIDINVRRHPLVAVGQIFSDLKFFALWLARF